MALRRQLLLILFIIVAIAVTLKIMEFFQSDVVEADATRFVLEDLSTRYPTADMSIMTITPKYNAQEKRYFEVKARVTEDPLSPCPKRSHIFYNYPVQNFVPQPAEIITSNCRVCTAGICTIAFPEEAIIASHTLNGTSEAQRYITANPSAIPVVTENPDSWLVKWVSDKADSYYVVQVHRNGTVPSVDRVVKS